MINLSCLGLSVSQFCKYIDLIQSPVLLIYLSNISHKNFRVLFDYCITSFIFTKTKVLSVFFLYVPRVKRPEAHVTDHSCFVVF